MSSGSDERLVSYGTLVPGGSNHHVVKDLGGRWEPAQLTGVLEWLTPEIPRLRWHGDGPPVTAWLLHSPALLGSWDALDDFEGSAYERRVVPVATAAGVVAASCYVDPDSPLASMDPPLER